MVIFQFDSDKTDPFIIIIPIAIEGAVGVAPALNVDPVPLKFDWVSYTVSDTLNTAPHQTMLLVGFALSLIVILLPLARAVAMFAENILINDDCELIASR